MAEQGPHNHPFSYIEVHCIPAVLEKAEVFMGQDDLTSEYEFETQTEEFFYHFSAYTLATGYMDLLQEVEELRDEVERLKGDSDHGIGI